MSNILEGKVALVTGAGSGIGRAIAVAMARAGASVVINDIGVSLSGEGGSASPAEETKAEIEASGGEAAVSTDSVADWESARRIVQTAVESFGRLDIVVNNAGILRDAMFHKMSIEHWQSVVNVHLNGTFYVSRAAAELFRERECGSFIHMVSTSGLIGNLGQSNYSAAKMGVAGLSKSIALDMKRYNVRSNCIAPFAWGRMTSNIPAQTPDQITRVENLKKMTPAKNAPLAVFLGSGAAHDISGQIFSVRRNEIFVMGQSRPARAIHSGDGWTPETVRDHAIPALRAAFYPLERSQDVFTWDPC